MAVGKQPDLAAEDVDAEGGGSDGIFAEINITPLTDVFLVMVIIFMVSALAVQAEQNEEKQQKKEEKKKQEDKDKSGLELNLPQGQSADIDPSKASLIIEIPLDGKVYVNFGTGKSRVVTDEELEQMFRKAYVQNKATQVILKADRGVQHGRVVGVMDRAKQAGLSKLAIGTGGK